MMPSKAAETQVQILFNYTLVRPISNYGNFCVQPDQAKSRSRLISPLGRNEPVRACAMPRSNHNLLARVLIGGLGRPLQKAGPRVIRDRYAQSMMYAEKEEEVARNTTKLHKNQCGGPPKTKL